MPIPVCPLCGFLITDQTVAGSIPVERVDTNGEIVFDAFVHTVHQRINGVLQPVIQLAP